jgi:hypothetical protein
LCNTKVGTRPRYGTTVCANDVIKNITTFAAISAFNVVEIGPGPNENEDAA